MGFTVFVFLPVLQPWARASGLLLTAALHLGIALTMSIPDFSVVMWISYILFFEPSWVLWLERHLRRLFQLVFLFPLNVLALIANFILPKHEEYFSTLVVYARKRTDEEAVANPTGI